MYLHCIPIFLDIAFDLPISYFVLLYCSIISHLPARKIIFSCRYLLKNSNMFFKHDT